jgi:hypothetical protein
MIRICPMRDGPCPHGLGCLYVGDGAYGYPCKPGWKSRAAALSAAPSPTEGKAASIWQWRTIGSWHTVDSGDVEDPEAYARAMAAAGNGRVRQVWTQPAPSSPTGGENER